MTRHTPPAPALVNATVGQLKALEAVASEQGWSEITYDVHEERQRRVIAEARTD